MITVKTIGCDKYMLEEALNIVVGEKIDHCRGNTKYIVELPYDETGFKRKTLSNLSPEDSLSLIAEIEIIGNNYKQIIKPCDIETFPIKEILKKDND